MKRYAIVIAACCAPLFVSNYALGADASQKEEVQAEAPKVQLREPFNRMTPTEVTNTGIGKLSAGEQDALATWWNQHKGLSHPHKITKEVTISSIPEEGKVIELSDGSKISFSSSNHKKVSRWAVGDVIGIGESGRRGAITLYHMSSGQKVKGKRDQAPQQKNGNDKKKS
jgi:hypothetical protein